MKTTRELLAALLTLCVLTGSTLAADDPASPGDVRVQIQEIVYEVRPDGSASPIDHRILDVFDVRFEQQYGSVERSSGNLDFGMVYFAVPRDDPEVPNYNVYLYLRDTTHEVVADGYLNNEVPGALFKLTTMLLERAGNRAYARIMHCLVPPTSEADTGTSRALEARRIARQLDERVRVLLARTDRRAD